ncbi:RNA-binding domain-containing protein [Rhizobium acaciae]|uniref:RNA-binding domain-containing protein n=1 Tax=Rhizobium acaciae TaxID=2989736 RepID=UPI00221E8400|nr:RNA-binding domain-containing protein [Rhizobium acaciae]MCW1753033.1 putative DNA binding domain-containing protein [Rhizobium acaciae]
MTSNKRSKALSSLTLSLLTGGESNKVDFKKIPDGVSADDLVAFANSEGGQILIGVVEETLSGAQVGTVRGCDVSDGTILQITNKAISCIPPVSIDIFIENLSSQPILRVEIPPSSTKPHCTQKGVYCKRDGSRNRPLHPNELLRIFLDTEARAFSERFETAADRITSELGALEDSLDGTIRSMADQLGWAESQLDDTESNIRAILGIVNRIDGRSGKVAERIRALFRQDKRDDPVWDHEYQKLTGQIIEVITERGDLVKTIADGGAILAKATASLSEELTEDDFKKALNRAVEIIHDREQQKMYAVACKSPSKCTERELDGFCAIVAEGGEVGEGLRSRVENAFRLGFITYTGTIVGTAALKKPLTSYRNKVFGQAKSGAKPNEYPYELGWIFLQPQHRHKGQMTKLLADLLPLTKGKNLFATTRTNNELMPEMLIQLKFLADGEPYASNLKSHQTLQLFLRSVDDSEEAGH